MNAIDRVIGDLRKGENIDLYVSIVSGLALAILNPFGLVTPTLLSSITLAILAIVASGILNVRHNQSSILENLKLGSGQVMVQADPPQLNAGLETASDALLIGAHLSDYIQRNYSVFVEKLKRGDHIRVLIYPPDGLACSMTAMRFAGSMPVGQENARIQYTLDTLGLLKRQYPDRLEIRTLDFLFSYNYYIFDPHSPKGIAILDRYTFRTAGGSHKPRLLYTKSDVRWFELVVNESEQLWDAAKSWSVLEQLVAPRDQSDLRAIEDGFGHGAK